MVVVVVDDVIKMVVLLGCWISSVDLSSFHGSNVVFSVDGMTSIALSTDGSWVVDSMLIQREQPFI